VPWDGPHSLVLAGPTPLPYADFVRAVARAAGQRPSPILGIPAWPLMAIAAVSAALPRLVKVRPAEIRRLLEDKAFNIAPMIATLGVRPISLDDGLMRTFRRLDLDQ